jgi:hypothetical protein
MACGVPTVVSRIPVSMETTGGNALFADHSKPKEWLEAFGTLEDKNVRRQWRQQGLKWVEPLRGRKGWSRHVADISEAFNSSD